ncbi:MAG: nitroreductase/quinone reductase family protein [Rubrobacteraceae bacterium]
MSSTTKTTTTAPARIRSSVPSKRVLRSINPFVSDTLRSPFHRLLSGGVMLLTFTGRKTGKQYTFPVNYAREGDTLTVFSSKSWWKNLRGGGRVAVRLQGRGRTARAEVIRDRAAVLEAVERLEAEYGLKGSGRRIGLTLDISPPPTRDELAAALEDRVVIRLTLDPETRS